MRLLLLMLAACVQSPQHYLTYSASARSSGLGDVTAGAWQLTFSEARLLLGPMYFCPAANATLCDEATSEVTSVSELDLLATEPQPLGDAFGLSGEVRSVSFDYGISWSATQTAPTMAHSAVFAGVATSGTTSVPFFVAIDIPPQARGSFAVPSSRASGSVTNGVHLDVRIDAASWWAGVDFAQINGVIPPESSAYASLVQAMQAGAPPSFRWLQ